MWSAAASEARRRFGCGEPFCCISGLLLSGKAASRFACRRTPHPWRRYVSATLSTALCSLPQPRCGAGVSISRHYSVIMKHGEKMLSCTLAGLALCIAANAAISESSGSPYLGIVERNVFGLKPPPPPPDPAANKPPPPKIFLQGITTFGGIKRALFKAQMPPKPGEPPKGEQSFILAEGQRDGDMEVVAIDANPPGSDKVSAFSTIITLDFEHNGIKTT